MWVVQDGLKPGERIIIEGLQKVQDGGVVNPVERQVDSVTGAIVQPEKVQPDQNTPEEKPDTADTTTNAAQG